MSIRVALIGNMNNNHFALMRYLRDIGFDAHLLMYRDEAEHFLPQCDTWQWEKWMPYVHQLPFSNGGLDLDSLFPKKERLYVELGGYDFTIGNGIAPVLFLEMGKILDLFLPYSEGVEFIMQHHFCWQHPRAGAFSLLRKYLMESAIRRSVKKVVTANMHPHSQNTYKRLGVNPINLPLPMLYIESQPDSNLLPEYVRDSISRMNQSNLVVLSHVSHIWKNLPVPHYMGGVGKRNNWLVQGFAQYVRESSNMDALLCLFEYGRDVTETKELINQLGISRQVVWFPKMNRREIMCLLPHADIGGSEFAGMYWGGCGWEFLASGVSMLHQLDDPALYESPEMPLPPFFNVHGDSEICQVLLENDRKSLSKMGVACREWFDGYQGYALARRYGELIEQLRG